MRTKDLSLSLEVIKERSAGEVLDALRRLMPERPVTWAEALSVAERQALRLVALLGLPAGPVGVDSVASRFPNWLVNYEATLPTSGLTTHCELTNRWFTFVSAAEPATRQRVSVMHELKHLVDHDALYVAYLSKDGAPWAQKRIELLCDYFAGCVLMPRPWVKAAYVGGVQSEGALARHFVVSEQAAKVRLGQLGLIRACDTVPQRRGGIRGACALERPTTDSSVNASLPLPDPLGGTPPLVPSTRMGQHQSHWRAAV